MGTNLAYTPVDSNTHARPVQVEAPLGLHGVITPGGNTILFWTIGDEVHYANIGQNFHQALADDIVQAEDIQTAVVFTDNRVLNHVMIRASAATVGSELMLVTSRIRDDNSGITSLYVANNADNPTSWSLRDNIDVGTVGGTGGIAISSESTGTVYRMASGRLLYQGGLWDHGLGVHWQRSGVWFSDDTGASWENVVNQGYYVGGRYLMYHSNQLELDPITGDVFWSGIGSISGSGLWTSSDGETWDKDPTDSSSANNFYGFVNDGSYAYTCWVDGTIRRVDDLTIPNAGGAGFTNVATWNAGVSMIGTEKIRMAHRAIVDDRGVAFFFFNDDTVAWAAGKWGLGKMKMGQSPWA